MKTTDIAYPMSPSIKNFFKVKFDQIIVFDDFTIERFCFPTFLFEF